MPDPTASAMPAPAPMSRSKAWLVAIRPATLPAAIGPVLVGLAVAISLDVFVALPALASLVVAMLLQIASNVGNDLSDHRSGIDTEERLGPPRAAASGLLSEREILVGLALIVALAGVVGLYLVWVGGLVILVLGIAAVISAFAYSGGPWPYGYHGLGEVFVFIFFGLVAVAGTTYLQTLTWEPLAFVAAIPVGALITAILVINNLRDIDTDAKTGKRTLAVMLGERGAMAEYDFLLGVAYVVPVALVISGDVTLAALLPLASLPLTLALFRVVHAGGDPRRLNPVLRETARLSLVFCVLFAIGLAVPGLS